MRAALLETDTTSSALPEVLHVVGQLLMDVGPDRVAGVSIHTGNIRIQPSELVDGEAIARSLGLESALDHYTLVPAFTDWWGQVEGVEVHVRGALRGGSS